MQESHSYEEHKLARWSLNNRALIAVVSVVAAAFGAVALTLLQQELIPSVQSPQIAIVTDYEGSVPAVVDHDVSQVLEETVRSIDGLTSASTVSSADTSIVSATFKLGSNIEVIEQKLLKAITSAQVRLPDGLSPRIITGSVDDIPVVQFAVSNGSGDGTLSAAQRRTMERAVEDVEGVRTARFLGASEQEIVVTPRAEDLQANGVTLAMLEEALKSSGGVQPAGTVASGDHTLRIQSGSQFDSPEAVQAVPLIAPAVGSTTTVGAIADVTVRDAVRNTIARVDGQPGLVLSVEKVPSANIVNVAGAVRDEVRSLDQRDGTSSRTIFDQSPYIESSIQSTALEGLIGLICALAVVFAFLASVRLTLITVVSIPLSLCVAAVTMHFMGESLNVVTLGALTVALGRLVDDSIVVVESIEREKFTGPDRAVGIARAVGKVARAVISSTLTTVAVFLPLAFVSGATGALFRPFALTASAALIGSLVVSLTTVPVLAYWFLKDRGSADSPLPDRAERMSGAMARFYAPILKWSLRHSKTTISLAAVIVMFAVALLPGLATSYISGLGRSTVVVTQRLAPEVTLTAQETSAKQVEDELKKLRGVKEVQTTIGSSGNIVKDAALGGGSGISSYVVTPADDVPQAKLLDEIRAQLDDLSNAGSFRYMASSDIGFSTALDVEVTAKSSADLQQAVTKIEHDISSLPSVSDVDDTVSPTREFVDVQIDNSAALAAGLTERAAISLVAEATDREVVGEAYIDAASLKIIVSPPGSLASDEEVGAVVIVTPTGPVPISAIATVTRKTGPLVVQTTNGQPSATVSIEPSSEDLGTATSAITEKLATADLPPGAAYVIAGAAEDQGSAFSQLGAVLLVAMLIVYTVMVATFRSLMQPLVLLASVPFAATGALVAQRLSGEPLGVSSIIGLLMLVGIVVTNAIVLFDRINQYRSAGGGLTESVVAGATTRVRPILMTALATVFALAPMAFGITGHDSFISRPLAVVVVGGLLSSTLLTLVVLPVAYYGTESTRERLLQSEPVRHRRARGSAAVSRVAKQRGLRRRRPRGREISGSRIAVAFRGSQVGSSPVSRWWLGKPERSDQLLLVNMIEAPPIALGSITTVSDRDQASSRRLSVSTRTLGQFVQSLHGPALTDIRYCAAQLALWELAGVAPIEVSLSQLDPSTADTLRAEIVRMFATIPDFTALASVEVLEASDTDGPLWLVLTSTDPSEQVRSAIEQHMDASVSHYLGTDVGTDAISSRDE